MLLCFGKQSIADTERFFVNVSHIGNYVTQNGIMQAGFFLG